MNKFIIWLGCFTLLLIFSGCASTRITDDPVNDAYLGETTTFEGNVSYTGMSAEAAFGKVKEVLLDNQFKVTESDLKGMQLVASREVQSGFVTLTAYFYTVSEGVRLRVLTQVPRQETGYYRLHEEIISQLKR